MPNAVNLSTAFGLAPKDAIDYFARRGHALVKSWNWTDIWQENHARAFTVAKVLDLDVLKDIRDSLQQSINKGESFATWKKNLEPTLRAKGWWGRREVIDEVTGEIRNVDLSAPWRLNTIYRTNTQTAFMAGRWQRFRANIHERPYWQYIAIMDMVTRPAHAAMHKKVFRLDDPKAARIWPPNDFNCRCRPRALSADDLARQGIKPEDTEKYLQQVEEDDPVTGGKITRSYYKSPGMKQGFVTGKGWDYNVGEASFSPALDKYPAAMAQDYVSQAVRGPAFERFLTQKVGGSMPVGVIPAEIAKALNVETRVVSFTAATRDKNIDHHPELSPFEYQLLPSIFSNPDYVVRDRDNAAVFVRLGETWWHAAVKAIPRTNELLMSSFRRTDVDALKRLLKKGTILKKPEGEV